MENERERKWNEAVDDEGRERRDEKKDLEGGRYSNVDVYDR